MARVGEAMATESSQAKRLKRELRAKARVARQAQPNKDALSRRICGKFAASPEYASARTVMLFVDFGDEVRTRHLLAAALEEGKAVVVPYCEGDVLKLFRLMSTDELSPGTWGILEPKAELRARCDRRIGMDEVDLVMVPGVAFDRRGGRLGHGKGYYDKLLVTARADTPLIAVAFECQMFPEVPMLPHDATMDKVITETAVYEAQSRRPTT